ncbi:MAG: GNAT family N-acyltransferase [Sideroxyarcus sp.]|nr:GNAT family N-acyltransferase [Sideroxyarcus sp.]
MLELIRQPTAESQRRLTFSLARNLAEITEAQRIRYKVFGEEMGANLPSAVMGLDIDRFDQYCDHLLVRDHGNDRVVGTYRILPPEQARAAGGYYSETEFDLSRLTHLRERMVEVGRSCVHPDYRDGATITQLWSGLADYIGKHNHEYLIGCASVSMADGGHYAASVYNQLHRLHAAPSEYTVFPHCRLPLESLNQNLQVAIPPLLKGYLRLGAYISGEPAWDPDFNCADLFILLPVSRLNARYAKHFMRKAA